MNRSKPERILDKIVKLIRYADSARSIGNVAEAEAFAARINDMLIKHKLSIGDIEREGSSEGGIAVQLLDLADLGLGDSQERVFWSEGLAVAIAIHHFCTVLVHPQGREIYFVGRNEDRQIAMYIYIRSWLERPWSWPTRSSRSARRYGGLG
ncbi:MAG TPA: DUF2786 domain-containing protein [Blastocatellia bacterium]|nr:DUF2786 domain-containing protein [Blastocatellia bacterium]